MNSNESEYDDKRREFLRIKNNGGALKRVKNHRNTFKTWKANAVNTAPGKDVGMVHLKNIVDYFTQDFIGATQALSGNTFTVEYQLYNDLTREQVIGEDTIGVQVPIEWNRGEITAFIHPGGVRSILSAGWAVNFYTVNANRSELSKGTGWSRDECNRADISTIQSIKNLLQVAVAGQHKLTRLVKGFLIYLDLLHNGKADFRHTIDMDEQVELHPTEVANEFDSGGAAFVHSSAPNSMVHNSMCYLMASEYPNAISRTRHIIVPADAPRIKLVTSRQRRPHWNVSCTITADLAVSAICKYAADFNLQGDMQQAYTIACALMENKYLTRVSLPAVVSQIDLVPTALLMKEKNATAPFGTKEFTSVVGKIYQMSCLITAKDMICAAEATTKRGLSGNATLEMYLSHHKSSVERTGAYATALPMLELCPEMDWLGQLDSADMDYLREEVGAFEALWLCRDATIGVEKGMLQVMLQGIGDKTRDNKHTDRLVKELTISGVTVEAYQVPESMFVVEGTCIHVNQRRAPRRTKWKKYDLSIKSRPEGNLPEVRLTKPARRKNVHSSAGYTSNRSSVVSPIRNMAPTRETVDDRARDIETHGVEDEEPMPKFVVKALEQMIAEEATGLDTRPVHVRPNVLRDPRLENYLELASKQMDEEDFYEYHTMVDHGVDPDNIPAAWDKTNTGVRSAMFLVEQDIQAFRAMHPSHPHGPEWKRDALELAMEQEMLSRLLKCPTASAFADQLKFNEMLWLDFPDGELKDEVQARRDEETSLRQIQAEAMAISDALVARKTSFESQVRDQGRAIRRRKIDRDESEIVAEGAEFDGNPEDLTIRQMFDVCDSDRFKKFVKDIGAGKKFMGKDSVRGVIEWAEAAKVSSATMTQVAQYLGDTTVWLGSSPLKGDKNWLDIGNIEVPPSKGTSAKVRKFKPNDARLAAFYISKGWRGLPANVFEQISSEYIIPKSDIDALFKDRSSFTRK